MIGQMSGFRQSPQTLSRGNRDFSMSSTRLPARARCAAQTDPAGPALSDRIRIVHALHAVGLEADARAFALEGLMALK